MQIFVDTNLTYKIKILQYIGRFRCENIWNAVIISRWQSTSPLLSSLNVSVSIWMLTLKLLKCKWLFGYKYPYYREQSSEVLINALRDNNKYISCWIYSLRKFQSIIAYIWHAFEMALWILIRFSFAQNHIMSRFIHQTKISGAVT